MKYFRLSIIFFLLINSSALAEGPPSLRALMQDEFEHFPKMQLDDVYKFAFQAAMGNEHSMADTAGMKKYLVEELAAIDTTGSEPLIEYLRPDSAIARVNLRTFKKVKADPCILFAAMIRTAQEFTPSVETLKIFLSDIEKLADDALIPFNVTDVHNYFETMKNRHYPAIHHSAVYEKTYKPGYRVIAGGFVKELQ